MKYVILFGLLLSGCATTTRSYEESTTAEYIGNDQYTIGAYGARRNTEEGVQGYFYKKAFTVCYKKAKGFEVISSDLSSVPTSTVRVARGVYKTHHAPRMTGVVKCTGAPDLGLIERFGLPPKVETASQ